MRRSQPLIAAAVAALAAASVGCDAENLASYEQPIVNGTPHTGDPAVVLVNGGCTGTLISPKVVLTAAHCVVDPQTGVPLPATGMEVTFSGTGVGGGPSIPVTELAAGRQEQGADVALLALAQASEVAPIPHNTRDLVSYVNQPIRIVGFGAISENDQGPPLKRQGTSSLLGVGPLGTQILAGEMYAAPSPQGTCYGDSGGPAFMTLEGREYVVGITSRGAQANGLGQIPPCGVGVDVSARTDSHRAFIEAFIARVDPTAPGPQEPAPGPGSGGVDPGTDPESGPGTGEGAENPGNIVGGCAAVPGTADGGAVVLLALAGLSVALRSRRRVRRG